MRGKRAYKVPERRRSERIRVAVPVDVLWRGKDGVAHTEQAKTIEVNAHGAFLQMKNPPPVSTEIELGRRKPNKKARARVVGRTGLTRVAVELAVPSYAFWGVSFPPAPPIGTSTG